MPKTTSRIKTAAIPAPRTREEAEALLAAIGRAQREVVRIEANLNDAVESMRAQAAAEAAPHNEQIEQSFAALHAWAEAHRDELCPRGTKTARLASGELSWRQRPPSVRVTGAERVIEALRRLGLSRLIRTREEVDKEAILAEPEAVRGVRGITVVTGVEDFVAKPYETEIERAEPVLRQEAA
jgi:phage host-nuclease inhibitor protein Gam